MELYLNITIEKVIAKVSIPDGRNDNILGFGTLKFYDSGQPEPIWKITGFTIRKKDFNGKPIVTVVFPAFRSGNTFKTAFYLFNKSLWQDFCKLLLDAYYQEIGDTPLDADTIDINDIPDDLGTASEPF